MTTEYLMMRMVEKINRLEKTVNELARREYTKGGGSGDMLKSVYDADNDDVVDIAEAVPWSGITDKPSTFPPSSHAHAASDITSGTLSTDRFSAYDDLVAENKIGGGNAQVAPGIAMQYRNMFATPTDHFESGTNGNEPSTTGWGSWATNAGFSTPDGINYITYRSLYYLSFLSGTNKKGFLPRSASITTLTGLWGEVKAVLRNAPSDSYVGVRIDNNETGSSENAVEIVIKQTSSGISIVGRQTSSGSVTEYTKRSIPFSPFLCVQLSAGGTYYSNWYVNAYMKANSPAQDVLGFAPGGLTWQPQRLGLTFYVPDTAAWYYGAFVDMWSSGI